MIVIWNALTLHSVQNTLKLITVQNFACIQRNYSLDIQYVIIDCDCDITYFIMIDFFENENNEIQYMQIFFAINVILSNFHLFLIATIDLRRRLSSYNIRKMLFDIHQFHQKSYFVSFTSTNNISHFYLQGRAWWSIRNCQRQNICQFF